MPEHMPERDSAGRFLPVSERSGGSNGLVPSAAPLNATQQKNLERLIEGDFADLTQGVVAEIDRRARQRVAELEAQYGAQDSLSAAYKTLSDLVTEWNATLTTTMARLREKDHIEPKGLPPIRIAFQPHDTLAQAGRSEALQKVESARQVLKGGATRVLQREERRIRRQILLNCIPGTAAATTVLEDMPDRDDMMRLIFDEFSQDPDAVAELGLKTTV